MSEQTKPTIDPEHDYDFSDWWPTKAQYLRWKALTPEQDAAETKRICAMWRDGLLGANKGARR